MDAEAVEVGEEKRGGCGRDGGMRLSGAWRGPSVSPAGRLARPASASLQASLSSVIPSLDERWTMPLSWSAHVPTAC